MELMVNGKPLQLAENACITSLLQYLQLADKPVAVEVNQTIIPRSLHGQHQLHPGDRVEIVHAIGGG